MTTCLKKSKSWSPVAVLGKNVTGVDRGHEMMDVTKMPMRIEPLIRNIINNTVKML